MEISFVLLVFCLLYFKSLSAAYTASNKIEIFLNGKSNEIYGRIRKTRTAEPNTKIVEDGIAYYKNNSINQKSEIHAFSLFDKSFYALSNNVLLEISNKTNFHISSQAWLLPNRHHRFLKAFKYENIGIVVAGNNIDTFIYTLAENSTKAEFIHALSTPNAADAILFINNKKLYLVISSHQGNNLGSVTIYKWLGSHFDEIESMHIVGPLKMGSFKHKNSQIIIILQYVEGKKMHSSVYDFKQETTKKIQFLNTVHPQHVDVIVQNNEFGVLVYENTDNNLFYKWNGFEMVLVNIVQLGHKFDKSMVVYSNSTPLIILPELDKIMVYRIKGKHIYLETSKQFPQRFTDLPEINKGNNVTFIAGLNEEYILNAYAYSFEINEETEKGQDEALRKCFNNLEEKIYDRRRKLHKMKEAISLASSDQEKAKSFRKREAANGNLTAVIDIENILKSIKGRLDTVRPLVIKQGDSSNVAVVNGKAIIRGTLVTKNVTAKNLNITSLNHKKWVPEHWLKYKRNQTIDGPVKIHMLSTKDLVTDQKTDRFFKYLLINEGNQELRRNLKVQNLSATKMFTNNINGINVYNIYLKSQPSPIKGRKYFKNVHSEQANIQFINGERAETILSRLTNTSQPQISFAEPVFIENLEAKIIDNITWSEFEKSVFKIGEDDTINGNISASNINTKNTITKNLNGINPINLLTKSTDQIINSTIEFDTLQTPEIFCDTLNGVNMSLAALDQDGTVIKGPVVIIQALVTKSLEIVGDIDESFFQKEGDRILGTNESDLRQIYTGKIVVTGNLHVKDLTLLPNSTIIVNKTKYSQDILNEYWTKNTNQVIPVHFKALNGITVPHLKTKYVNNISMDNIVLNNKHSTLKGPIIFKNLTVQGNVFLNYTTEEPSTIQKLALEGVKNDGRTYYIKGRKHFKSILKVNHLNTSEINGKEVTKDRNQEIKNVSKRILVRGDVISKNIYADRINGVDIRRFNEDSLALHQTQNLSEMSFTNISVEKLYVKNINGYNLTEYIQKLELLPEKQVKTIRVNGNVTIEKVQHVTTINGYNIKEILEKEPSEDESLEPDLIGDLKFTGKIKLGNLRAKIINNVDFPALITRLFYKKSNQTVTGNYTFKTLKTEHLYTKQINDVNVEDLIDVTNEAPQLLMAQQTIIFKNTEIRGSLLSKKMQPCDLRKATSDLHYPPSQEWAKVEILGNTTILNDSCELLNIIKKSVKKGEKNIITAPVNFKGHVLAERVMAHRYLNGINLTEIIKDAVLNNAEEEQVITGHKILTHVAANSVTVLDNADIPVVNDIYIPELYRRIIPKEKINETIILGKKTFSGGLQTEKFISDKVSGINPENIVSLTNLSHIPYAIFDNFEVFNDLNVNFINDCNMDFFLNNRLLTNTTEEQVTDAVFFFTDLKVDEVEAAQINNIELNKVVFDIGKHKILATKRFLQNLSIHGSAEIDVINGVNISDAYSNKALIRGRNEVINGSMTILKPVRFSANITAESINGYPITKIQNIMQNTNSDIEEGIIFNITEKVKSAIMETLPAIQHMPNELMYIERSDDLQVGIPNAIDARVTIIKDYALIHVESEESYEKCNLPEGCRCPVQHTVEITPQLSVSYLLNKAPQRIYSYDDDTMTVQLITNSISTSSHCRTTQTKVFNEISTLTWSTSTIGNATGSFNVYPAYLTGYISGVEFFTLSGITYIIVARYYDPVADTHDLDCTVLRFSEDKASVMEIQRIPTQGVWKLYLLHTARGITLVVGNHPEEPYTEIYRFKEDSQRFELLRTVAYECTKAVGVVLRTDSLIILANDYAPVQILKYNPHFDNYYYYQMFALEEPVVGLSVFYVGGFGISDAYLCIITEDNYRIYSFQYLDGWKLESTVTLRGLRNLIPFEINNQLYLFAASTEESSLLTVVKHGAGET